MIENTWRKLFERLRSGNVTPDDEGVITQAIAKVYPGRDYVLVNGNIFDIRFSDGETYSPEVIMEAIKDLEYTPSTNRPSNTALLDALFQDIKDGTLNTSGAFYKALDPYLD